MGLSGQLRRYDKPSLFAMIGYQTYPNPDGTNPVDDFHASGDRWRIVSAPARTSKSYASAVDHIFDVFPWLLTTDEGKHYFMGWNYGSEKYYTHSLGWIVAPDYKLCKEFQYLWDILVDGRKKYGWAYTLEKKQNNPDQGNMKITIRWGVDPWGNIVRSTIEGKSATNERSLQAEEVHWCIMSEAADQDARILNKYLSTRCKRIDFPTTPKISAQWLKDLIDLGEENPKLDIASFYYSRYCNPSYDHERFATEEKKAELRVGEGPGCAWKDPEFAEQFLGHWTYQHEAALPFRHEAMGDGSFCHVIEEIPEWVSYSRKFVATDYGFTDPAAAGWFAVGSDGTVVLYREIYQRGLTAMEFVNRIHDETRKAGERIEYYVGDPKKPEVARHMGMLGLPVININKKRQADRQVGHMQLCDMLAVDPAINRPRFFVYRACKNAIRELKLLRRKTGSRGEYLPTSFVGEDHIYDLTRYFLTTNPRGYEQRDAWDDMDELRQFALQMEKRSVPEHAGGLVGTTPELVAYA